jgi:hypothetical protein
MTEQIHIMVNGRSCPVATNEDISYETIVTLSGMKGQPSVTYHRGHHSRPDGTLAPGQKVAVYNGMIFNVANTTHS